MALTDATKQRYRDALLKAFGCAEQLMARLNIVVRLTPISTEAVAAWHSQWLPMDRQPPQGGWDWSLIQTRYHREFKAFSLAAWVGVDLCALSVGEVSETAVKLVLLEGAPSRHCPLRGLRAMLVTEAGYTYAETIGRKELHILDPAPALITHYQRFGFEMALASNRVKTRYLRRTIS